jgi:sialidase-1
MNTPQKSTVLPRRTFVKALAASSSLAVLPNLRAAPTSVSPKPAAPSADGLERLLLRPRTAANVWNNEGSGIVLRDGSILLLYSEFFDVDLMPERERPPFSPRRGRPMSDDPYARIAGITSRDGGRSWSAPRVYVDDADALVNTMSPAIVRLKNGRLMLAYSWRSGGNQAHNYGPCARRVRFSDDEGATWSAPRQITPGDDTYHTGCHDRAWVLESGRVIVQCHTNTPRIYGPLRNENRKSVYVAYSDDHGETWRHSNQLTEPDARGLNEACIAPRPDGSLLMVLRSWRGQVYLSESKDQGTSWSAARPSGIVAPDSPTYIKPIPGTSDLLMIWNCNYNVTRGTHSLQLTDGSTLNLASHAVSRCPLLCAVSRDGGRTWSPPRVLEKDINFEWAYPGVVFHGEHALIHYFRSPAIARGRELMLTRVPLKWLYEVEPWHAHG